MKTSIQNLAYSGLTELNNEELAGITGGSFWEDLAYAIGYTSRVVVELVKYNIEHPIGVEGGYPPK